VGLTLILLGNRSVLGGGGAGTLRRLAPLFGCCLAAYGAVYGVFTGYVYSGYLVRHVPFFVFLTDLWLALGVYVPAKILQRSARRAYASLKDFRRRLAAGQEQEAEQRLESLGRELLISPLLPAAVLVALAAGLWLHLQVCYVRLAPPDSYSFLHILRRPPFRGHSVVTNNYPAPMAWEMGSWGYADPSALTGTVTLTPRGFETEHDLKYLWLADRDANPAYLRPDFGMAVAQPVNLAEGLQQTLNARAAEAEGRPVLPASGLVRRTQEDLQPFLQDQLAVTDGRRFSIVRFDWDFPPYLRPLDDDLGATIGTMTLRQKLAISAASQNLHRRWRIELEPVPLSPPAGPDTSKITLLAATVDGQPMFSPAVLASAGWTPAPPRGSESTIWSGLEGAPLAAVVVGDQIQLQLQESPHSGRVRVTVNDIVSTLDLRADLAGTRTISRSIVRPYGKQTYIPSFTAGLYVRTFLLGAAAPAAAVEYRYAQQDGKPEELTTVRVYHEEAADHWRLADAVTFLGADAIPVRLEEFRRDNPDTVREYQRVARLGDRRTYEQWLAAYLAETPSARSRPGVVTEAGAVLTAGTAGIRRLRIPLPACTTGQLQISVTPGTWTKTGPEYMGLLFPAERPAAVDRGRSVKLQLSAPANADSGALPYGALQMRLRFPRHRVPQAEPIVATGAEEAGDFIYVIYVDDQHIRLGFDHWFSGGPVTKPIAIDYGAVHQLEISMGSLYPPADDFVFAGMPATQIDAIKDTVRVVLDGRTVIDTAAGCYESSPLQVTVGRNTINGTTSNPRFTGDILGSERVWLLPP